MNVGRQRNAVLKGGDGEPHRGGVSEIRDPAIGRKHAIVSKSTVHFTSFPRLSTVDPVKQGGGQDREKKQKNPYYWDRNR